MAHFRFWIFDFGLNGAGPVVQSTIQNLKSKIQNYGNQLNSFRRILRALVVLTSLTVASTAWAAREGQRVIAVDVGGVKAIAKQTIVAKVQTKPGGPYTEAVVSEDIRA